MPLPSSTILGKLWAKFQQQARNVRANATLARRWFRETARVLFGSINANELMRQNMVDLRPQNRITRMDIGRMFMYFYDPKLKETLPYYDRYPLMIPIGLYKDGFLGLNLHYIPWVLRARLLDALYSVYQNKYMDPKKKLFMSYSILMSQAKFRWFKPCIKRYLYGHIRSRFWVIKPEDWDKVLMLPTEKFEKATKQQVWKESIAQLGMYRSKSRHLHGYGKSERKYKRYMKKWVKKHGRKHGYVVGKRFIPRVHWK